VKPNNLAFGSETTKLDAVKSQPLQRLSCSGCYTKRRHLKCWTLNARHRVDLIAVISKKKSVRSILSMRQYVAVALLFVFFVGVNRVGGSKLLSQDIIERFLEVTPNPFIDLVVGFVVVQSTSVDTEIVVSLVAVVVGSFSE